MIAVNFVASLLLGLGLLSSTPKGLVEENREPVWIESGSRLHSFQVELARTSEQQARGLMDRKFMDPDHGMLFPLAQPRRVAFWMKNTYIPLDMLFVGRDGTILQIDAMTTPLSEVSHPSVRRVSAVLELTGGRSQELGIVVGDIVRHDFFDNLASCSKTGAQKPCAQSAQ